MIRTKNTIFDTIKKVLGRLTHIAYIFFPGRFFLNRIRGLHQRCEKYDRQNLVSEELGDFQLWLEFLERLTTFGTSINNVTTMTIDVTGWSDACETGLGGYTSTGQAFRFKIPKHLQGIFQINLLEFIVAKHTIDLALTHNTGHNIRIAHIGDNSSTVSWLKKTSFNEKKCDPQSLSQIISQKHITTWRIDCKMPCSRPS